MKDERRYQGDMERRGSDVVDRRLHARRSMVTPEKIEEAVFERWLSTRFIAVSDLARWVLFDNAECWKDRDDTAAVDFLEKIIRLFALGRCFDLANAAGLETGLPVALIRGNVNGKEVVAHAVVFDALTQSGIDIFGRRPMVAMIDEMRRIAGPVAVSIVTATAQGDDHETLAMIAAALPWMDARIRHGRRAAPIEEVIGLVEILSRAN